MIKKIVIINQPTKNRGDEAAHRSLMRMLNTTYPTVNIEVVFTQNDVDTIRQFTVLNPINKYTLLNFLGKGQNGFIPKLMLLFNLCSLFRLFTGYRRYFNILTSADVVICAPGGICMGGFHNWNHLFFLTLAMKAKKRIIYYSRSIGPFAKDKLSYRRFNKISFKLLHKMDFISLRDEKSIKIAESMRLHPIHAIDTAFLDRPDATIPNNLLDKIGDNYIVFVPNSLSWHPSFRNADRDKIRLFYISIIELLNKTFANSKIVMLPQLFNVPDNSDYKYFNELRSYANVENIEVIDEIYSSDIQQKIISNSKFVIGARYHSIVFAINNEIPFAALSYEHKITGLLEILNMKNRMIDINDLGKDKFNQSKHLEQLKNILENNNKSDLTEAHLEAQKIALQCFNSMSNYIK